MYINDVVFIQMEHHNSHILKQKEVFAVMSTDSTTATQNVFSPLLQALMPVRMKSVLKLNPLNLQGGSERQEPSERRNHREHKPSEKSLLVQNGSFTLQN